MTSMPLVRPAKREDVAALLPLMRALAEFEGYADRFVVTESTLIEQGFTRSPPDFECLVAESDNGDLQGMLVFYMIPFTFRARPTLFLKELYVADRARNAGVGEALMHAAAATAVERGCGIMKWQVARWNADAQRFYERLGAAADPEWVDYSLSDEECARIAHPQPGKPSIFKRPPETRGD